MKKSETRVSAPLFTFTPHTRRRQRLSDAPNSLKRSLFACERALCNPLKKTAPLGARCLVRDHSLRSRLARWLARQGRRLRGVLGAMLALNQEAAVLGRSHFGYPFPPSTPTRRDHPDTRRDGKT